MYRDRIEGVSFEKCKEIKGCERERKEKGRKHYA